MKVLAVQNLNTSLEKIKQKVSTIQEQITNLHNSISVFTDTEDVMKGKLGNSIRSFLLNVHQPFLFYLQQSLTDYEKAISNIEKLVSAYESDENGLIREEFVANALTNKLNKTFMETESVVSNINDIIQSISDLIYSSPLDLSNVSFKVDYGKLKLTRHIEQLYDIDVSALGKLGSVQSDLATMKSYLNNLDSKSRMGSLSVTNFNLSAVQGLTDYQTMKSSIYKKVVGLNGETIADMSLNDISTANDLLLLGVTPDVRLLLNHAYASLKENKLTEKVYLSVINYLKVSNAQRKHDDVHGSISSVTGANIKFLPNDSEEDRQLKEYLIKVKNGEVSDTNSLVNVCLPDSDDYGEITYSDKIKVLGGNSQLAGTPDGLAKPVASAFNLGLKTVTFAFDIEKGKQKGNRDFIIDTGKGLWNTIAHPIDTAESLVNTVLHPIDTSHKLADAIATSYERDMIHGDTESRVAWLTYAGNTMVTSVIGTKGADKVSKVSTTTAKETFKTSNVTDVQTLNLFRSSPQHHLATVDNPFPYNVIDSGNLRDQMIMAAKNSSKMRATKSSVSVISNENRRKLNKWSRPPSEKLYLANKHVYDNPKYFDQNTGNPIYPGMKKIDPNNPRKVVADPNIHGFVNGKYETEIMSKGNVIDRYGDNDSGRYFSPDGSSYESRALPPFMKDKPYEKYEVIKEFEVKTGEVAPWFGEKGKGIQHYSDSYIKDEFGNMVEANIYNLVENGYLVKID